MTDDPTPPTTRSTSRAEFAESGVAEVLDELDRELIGLAPVKKRIRETAALLLVERARAAPRPRARDADAAHELHRQPRHRQDHGGAAHGRPPAPARLCPQGPPRHRHARRSRRPVHRPHRAEDEGDPEEGDGRRALHRRGLLPLPAGERARLRPGGDRDPAAGDGEPARRPRRHPRRLRRPDGALLQPQPRLPLAHRPPHRLPRLLRRRALRASPSSMLATAELSPEPGGAGGARALHRAAQRQPHFANARSIRNALDRARLRQANRLFDAQRAGHGRGPRRPSRPRTSSPAACSPAARRIGRDKEPSR